LAQSILREGLKPRDRQYVHLSASLEDAQAVGKRRDPTPVVIAVKVPEARAAQITFYRSGRLYLVESVPPEFLSVKRS
jgi:putative RNA 2'-phosphotransferase